MATHGRARPSVARRPCVALAVFVVPMLVAGCADPGSRGHDCPDPCEVALKGKHPAVTATDASGAVRWRTTLDDGILASPFVSNGHLVLRGCRATHLLDIQNGAASTAPAGMGEVKGVVAGQVVGVPADDSGHLSAGPVGGSVNVHVGGSLDDPEDIQHFRSTVAVSPTRVVGVVEDTLHVWIPGSRWQEHRVALPLGSWRDIRVVMLDDTHAVVAGSDGSVMGVDVGAGTVLWRSHPTRPNPPWNLELRTRDREVEVTLTYLTSATGTRHSPPTSVPGERWRVDGLTGAPRGKRDLDDVAPMDTKSTVAASLLDAGTGWTIRHDLPQPAMVMCE